MRRSTVLALLVVVLVLGAMAANSLLVSVPEVRVRNSTGDFNAVRAKARLARVLADERPHPTDSGADDAVRERIVAELRAMGLNPVVRDQFACNGFQKSRFVGCARVRNVIAVLGPPTGKALLLSAHYDSVPVGPGASDDGVGVATLLEVGSILKDRRLKRPVILLFNEGEEAGLIGARAFLTDPLSGTVDSVLNFEARGVTGPVSMFETSRPNGAAAELFGKTVERPFASSLATDIYHLMPNDTDVTVYKERGWLALNFAMTGNETRYHSPADDLTALDPRSLQHMGDQALAISSELANGAPAPRGQRLFTDVLGRTFVQLPMSVGIAIFAILLAGFGLVAFRRVALGRALAAPFAGLVFGTGAAWIAALVMGALREGIYWRAHPHIGFVAIYATVLAVAAAMLRTIGASATREQLRVAYWLMFLLVGAVLALVAPGALIYFLGPPALVAGGMAASRWQGRAEPIASALAIALLYVTWGEMLALLEEIFSPGPLWVVAPIAAIVILPALIEATPLFTRAGRALTLITAAVVVMAAWAAVAVMPAYSIERPQRFTIEHVTEFPSGRSHWSVLNDGTRLPRTFEQTGRWRGGTLTFSDRMRALAPAPGLPGIAPPALEPLEILTRSNDRTLRLRLRTNGAERVLVTTPTDAHVRSAGVAGSVRSAGSFGPGAKFTLACSGRSCDGAELLIEQASLKKTEFTVVGSRNGLPPSAVPLLRLRPRFARPQYVPDQTVAVVSARI